MGAKGVIVQKLETGIPDCHIIQFSERKDLELRVTLRKPKYRQIHRSLHTPDFPEALKRFGAVYADVIAEPDIYSHTNSVLLTKLVDEFMTEQAQRVSRGEIAPGTHKGKDRSLYKGFIPFCVQHKLERVSELSSASFKNYGAWRKDNFGYEQETINTEIRHLKEFLFWIQKAKGHAGGIEWLVPTLRKVKGGPKPNSAYTDDMVVEMMTYLEEMCDNPNISPYQRWMWKLFTQFFILQMECGCRTSEFTYVQWKHVKLKGWNPHKPDELTNIVNDVHIPISKTGPRDIVFESSALVVIKRMYEAKGRVLNPEDYVFSNLLTRKRQGPAAFNAKFKEMHDHFGYGDEFTLYSTRSVYISDRIVQGSPISLIAQQCGNSSRIIEDRYQDVILRVNAAPLIKRNGQADGSDDYFPIV